MKKLVLATIAAGTLLSAPALAADMAVKARPPVLSPAFNWSGFYIGGDLGWQGSRMDLSDPIGGTLTYSPTHNGFAGGGFAGIQQQFGQFVLGVEGGYLAGTGRDNFSTPASVNIFIPGGTGAAEVRLRDIWSIGARAGLPMGMWMPYVTGGYGNGQFEFSAVSVPADAFTQQAKTNNGGATLVRVSTTPWRITGSLVQSIAITSLTHGHPPTL
jgi:outer membrane immunogenic protein